MSTKLKIIIAVVVLVTIAIVWYLIYKNKKNNSTSKTAVASKTPASTPATKLIDFEYEGLVYSIPETEFKNPKAPVSEAGFALATPDTWAAYLSNFKTRQKTVRENLGA